MEYYTESETYEQASIESSYRTNNETSGRIFDEESMWNLSFPPTASEATLAQPGTPSTLSLGLHQPKML